MNDADKILIALAAALAASVGVERVVELLKNVWDLLPLHIRLNNAVPKNTATARLDTLASTLADSKADDEREQIAEAVAALRRELTELTAGLAAAADRTALEERRAKLERDLADRQAALAALPAGREWKEALESSVVTVLPASDPDDGAVVRVLCIQLCALATGIIAARITDLSVFNVLLQQSGVTSGVAAAGVLSKPLDYLLTGLLIGGGSQPVHVLMEFVTQRKVPAMEEPAPAPSVTTVPLLPLAGVIPAAAGVAGAAEWLDLPYDGGVDREVLGPVHRRPAKPDLIVFHHTALSSASSFDDVVRVIKARTSNGKHWITGYHAVVTADGVIHPFCRWDRYGNHVEGQNRRSLGVSFNGNYETDPGVSFSNPDGRLGPPRPTEAQLRAGAQLTALWCLLYDISPDFARSVLPHKALAAKACPGSSFPYAQYQRLVTHFVQTWSTSPFAQERIEAYRLKPYLF